MSAEAVKNSAVKRFLVVGGGKMGESILAGWIASQVAPADGISAADIVVVEPGGDRRAYLEETHGVTCVADVADVAEGVAPGAAADATAPDVVVLSVKPQVMMGLLDQMVTMPAFQGGGQGPLFISIAAGLPTQKLAAALPAGARLVRVMPNLPLMVSAGASGVCAGETATKADVDYVAGLFGCLGRAVVVDESDMDTVCALSGSGPAYVAAMIESLRDAAAAEGLDPQLAETLALQTVLGTAQFIAETGITPENARIAVCSPGGTTLAALDAMNETGFDDVFAAGVRAAVRRSKELAQCSS